MKWIFSRVYNPTADGRKDFGVIYDEENRDDVICLFEKDVSDLDGRKMAYADEMYQEINVFIEQVNHGSFKPREVCKKFEALISKIKG
jgi:hypothetical protein